jgi:WhiB family redox-sensing transcriptional regulator
MSGANLPWRHQGACNGLNPSVFFPDSDAAAEEAKAICSLCIVRAACLEHAIVVREKDGVWGGATERERRRIIRQRRRTA